MPFDLTTWQHAAADKLGHIGHWFNRRTAAAPYLAYGTLSGLALWPLVEAARSGQLLPVVFALGSVAGNIGGNLVAEQIQRWADRGDDLTELEIAQWVVEQSDHPDICEALDAILLKLDAIPRAQAGLGEADRQWFTATLRGELARLGNLARFEMVVGGDVVEGNKTTITDIGPHAAVATEGGIAFTGRDQVIVQAGATYAPGATFIPTGDLARDRADLERRYLEWTFTRHSPLQLRGLDPRASAADQSAALALWAVYIALDTDWNIPADLDPRAALEQTRRRDRPPDPARQQELRPVSALEAAAAAPRLVLIGAPGSGKTTFLNYLTLCLAGARLGNPDWLAALQPAWPHGDCLPLRITLRDLAARGVPSDAHRGRAHMIWDYIARDLAEAGLGDWIETVQRLAAGPGLVFMFDGLDETPPGDHRDRVREAVDEFAQTCGRSSRLIVTARPYAYDDPNRRLSDFAGPFSLAAFDDEHIEQFITAWYAAVKRAGWLDPREADAKAASLQEAAARPDLRAIAGRPLLLTLMATLHTSHGRLPDDRVDLYKDIVEMLLWRWNEAKGDEKGLLDALNIPSLKLDDLRAKIEQVAFEAHCQQGHRPDIADIDCDAIIRVLRPLLGGSRDKAAQVVEYIERRAGLLSALGARAGCDLYAFPHRSFQEYLAGCYLAGRDDFRAEAPRLILATPTQWREVFILGARHAGADRGLPAADALIGSLSLADFTRKYGPPTDNQWRSAVVAGLALLEIGLARVTSEPAGQAVHERVTGWLLALIETPNLLALGERIEAGDALARLGDPRPSVTSVDAMEFCRVPAGPFWMGGDEYEDERPMHVNDCLNYDFWIGRYPITVAQFRAFIQASGHKPRDEDSLRGLANHPVVNVTWHDARAFCDWLTQRWQTQGRLPAGWAVRLPSETEWEKAARGGLDIPAEPLIGYDWPSPGPARLQANDKPKRVYPWGDDPDPNRANYDDTGINAASAVGCFPGGVSPYGCLDMAGNVWEWTRSLWGKGISDPEFKYPYNPTDGRENLEAGNDVLRVMRGGSYGSSASIARCASRRWYSLYSWPADYGFRIIVSPISQSL